MPEELPDQRDEGRLPSRPTQEDDEAMREYGRQIAIDSLLNEFYAHNAGTPSIAPEAPKQKVIPFRWFGAGAAAVAALAVIGLVFLNPDTTPNPPQVGWNIEAFGEAEWERLSATHITLTHGELLVESMSSDSQPLAIKTPNSTATAESTERGARMFVGTHTDPPSATQPNETAEVINSTRILVLAGIVSLANSSGTVSAEQNQLVQTIGEGAPTATAVEANADFGIRLFQDLVKRNGDENLFISPFSLTSALAMTAEGARGETAEAMGEVLGFPEITRRTGEDSARIPWEISKIHAGMAALRSILDRQEEAPERQTLRSLRAQLAALKAKMRKLPYPKEGPTPETVRALAEFRAREQKIVDQINAAVDPHELRVANALWCEQTYPFRKDYVDAISESYGTSGAFPADFRFDPENTRRRINKWSAEQTNNRIKNLIARGAIDLEARLVIASAIFFRGDWATPFSKRATRDRLFTLLDGNVVKALTMGNFLDVGYAAFNGDGTTFSTPKMVDRSKPDDPPRYPADGGFMMAELPYRGNDLVMTVLVPIAADGLPKLENDLNADSLETWIGQMEIRGCSVRIPKFKMSTDLELKEALGDMGMGSAFIEPSRQGGADFSGMTTSDDPDEQLFLSQVVHKTWIEVNEKGTEAAAVTAVVAKDEEVAADLQPFYPQFKVNRPFLFLIRDRPTGAVLFIGRVTDPREESAARRNPSAFP